MSDRTEERKRRLLRGSLRRTGKRMDRLIRRKPDHRLVDKFVMIRDFSKEALLYHGENEAFEHVYTSLENEDETPKDFLERLAIFLDRLVDIFKKLLPIIEIFLGMLAITDEELTQAESLIIDVDPSTGEILVAGE